VLFEKD